MSSGISKKQIFSDLIGIGNFMFSRYLFNYVRRVYNFTFIEAVLAWIGFTNSLMNKKELDLLERFDELQRKRSNELEKLSQEARILCEFET